MIKCVAAFVAPDECHLFVGLEKRRCMPQHWLYTVILPFRFQDFLGPGFCTALGPWVLSLLCWKIKKNFEPWGFEHAKSDMLWMLLICHVPGRRPCPMPSSAAKLLQKGTLLFDHLQHQVFLCLQVEAQERENVTSAMAGRLLAIDCCMVLSSPQFCCTAAIASSRSS